ncbi:MAG: efflux RND transporter periplasmic adaptor subunit, partial [Alicyclobacillaceae bacterium]|nr:efflux RND transporter periplasmic adaptor subunit [Alicyclobacillaceae bacterium]
IQAPSRPDPPRTAPLSPSPAPVVPPPVALTSPIDGVVLYTAAIPGTIWSSGRKLAVLADLSKPFVTAYMDDRTVKYLAVGKDVDVYLDAYPGTSFPGRVVRIADAAGSFAAPELPSVAGTNQTRPVERVPVRIAVDNFFGKYVVPGMNATVRIHK